MVQNRPYCLINGNTKQCIGTVASAGKASKGIGVLRTHNSSRSMIQVVSFEHEFD